MPFLLSSFWFFFALCPVLSVGPTEPSNPRKSSHASILIIESDYTMNISANYFEVQNSFGCHYFNFERRTHYLIYLFCLQWRTCRALILGESPFGAIWSHLVRNSPKILSFFICIHLMVTSIRSTSQMNDLQKLHYNMTRKCSWNDYFMSSSCLETCHLISNSIRDQ